MTFQFQNTPPKLKFRQILALCDFSVSEYPPPKLKFRQILALCDFSVSEYPPENENCQRSWHFDFSVSEYPLPPTSENLNLGRSSQWETMCGKLPHVETLSNPDNYSFVTVCTCADVDKMYLTIYLSTHFLLICNQC